MKFANCSKCNSIRIEDGSDRTQCLWCEIDGDEIVKSFDASTTNPEDIEILKMKEDDGESLQDILEATYFITQDNA